MHNNDQFDKELKIEVIRWHQKLQEITYLEAGQHMRALNQLMWQIPSFAIAINGGLWYATTLTNEASLWMIFGFLTIFDLLTIITLFRLRTLIDKKITKQNEIDDLSKNLTLQNLSSIVGIKITKKEDREKRFKYIIVICWSICLILCSAINFNGYFNPKMFTKSTIENKEQMNPTKPELDLPVKSANGDLK